MKIYIAGPMSGIPQFNYPAFMAAAEDLRAQGHAVRNPAEMDDDDTKAAAMASTDGSLSTGTCNGETWGDFLARDVKIVADDVEAVALLPGWHNSRGARLEAFVALQVQKPVYEIKKVMGLSELFELDPAIGMETISTHTVYQGDVSRYGG